MLNQFSNYCLAQDTIYPEIRTCFIKKAEEALSICLKGCKNIREQERHFYASVVPEAVEKEAKARHSYDLALSNAGEWRTNKDFIHYLKDTLKNQDGLFHQILRGKINVHILPLLPEDVREEVRFYPRFKKNIEIQHTSSNRIK